MVGALDVLGADSLVAPGDVSMLGHGVEEGARVRRIEIEALVFAGGRVGVMVCFGEKVLRANGWGERESEQIALAGESGEPALESFFAYVFVGIGSDQVALADHVELARFRLHGSEGDAGDDLLIEVVLPVGNLG